jgi:predicted DsbA family dithiol-disulfide isomerase
MDFRERMEKKGGGRIPVEHFFEGPRRMGERVGLIFNFEKITKAPNTTLVHCLISLTPDGKVDMVIEDLYEAYFEHGQDIGDLEVLLRVAESHGLDVQILRMGMLDAETQARVFHEVEQAYRLGIQGVPFFVIDDTYAFSGAQPPEVITQILQRVEKEKK